MITRKTSWILATAASLGIAAPLFAQQAEGGHANSAAPADQASQSESSQRAQETDQQINKLLVDIAQDPKTASDKLFILTAAIHNQSEIELAKAVAQRTKNDQVRQMAERLIQRLQKTNDQLQKTAQALGMPLPQGLGQLPVKEVAIVSSLPEDQLDRGYTARVQADNAQDASQYQSESQIAQNPQVKQFAQDEQQGMRDREQDADQTAQGIGMQRQGEAQPAANTIRHNESDGK